MTIYSPSRTLMLRYNIFNVNLKTKFVDKDLVVLTFYGGNFYNIKHYVNTREKLMTLNFTQLSTFFESFYSTC